MAQDIHEVDGLCFPDVARVTHGGNAARAVRSKFLKKSTWMPVYWAKVRCKNPKSGTLAPEWIALNLPHEFVHVLEKHSVVSALLSTENLDPLTKEHLQFCEQECQSKLLGDFSKWKRSI